MLLILLTLMWLTATSSTSKQSWISDYVMHIFSNVHTWYENGILTTDRTVSKIGLFIHALNNYTRRDSSSKFARFLVWLMWEAKARQLIKLSSDCKTERRTNGNWTSQAGQLGTVWTSFFLSYIFRFFCFSLSFACLHKTLPCFIYILSTMYYAYILLPFSWIFMIKMKDDDL